MHPNSLKNPSIKAYEPKPRIEIPTEHALPFLSYIGSKLMHMGGFISFFTSWGLGTVKGAFTAKEKLEEAKMKRGHVRIMQRGK